MPSPYDRRQAGLSLVELLIAIGISLVMIGVISQVFVLTARTTQHTSARADTQAQARAALMNWETTLRDGYAVLTTFNPRNTTTTYATQITANERTVVAAVPALNNADGAPCTWKGMNMVFDCVVWRALKNASTGKWDLTRQTFTNAFAMPANVRAGYTIPKEFRRKEELTPVKIVSGAKDVAIELWGPNGLIAPQGQTTAPLPASSINALPQKITNANFGLTGTPIPVTQVSTIRITVECAAQTLTLQSGHPTTDVSTTETVSIRLRNKQTW